MYINLTICVRSELKVQDRHLRSVFSTNYRCAKHIQYTCRYLVSIVAHIMSIRHDWVTKVAHYEILGGFQAALSREG